MCDLSIEIGEFPVQNLPRITDVRSYERAADRMTQILRGSKSTGAIEASTVEKPVAAAVAPPQASTG